MPVEQVVAPRGDRLLASGQEAGTAPEDRRFRPDVEGLRAVAVLLVVLFHAGVPGLTGGYVGVDVFFVISGFVITGLLLRERAATGQTSIRAFYARRCRRIIPAATLVILVTVFFSYGLLGFVSGNYVANDGRWAAAFLANFHFSAIGTNYFASQRPPSPLQNYWSLSVEEQFYIVYPTIFLWVAGLGQRFSLRARMAVFLGLVIAASYALSIAQTSTDPTAAYFSPLTRAWELALGALIAVGASRLKQVPPSVAAATWLGLAGIVTSAFLFDAQTSYPGAWVALPVVGAGLIIAGGTASPRLGAESALGLLPFRWLGKLSYSLYLWHWPILVIAAERAGKSSLPLGQSLGLLLVALLASVVTFALVENPIRHARLPSKPSIGIGVGLAVGTIGLCSLAISDHSASAAPEGGAAANSASLLNTVAAAPHIRTVPPSITPSLQDAPNDWGGRPNDSCAPSFAQASQPICLLGDRQGRHEMVLYGDSHALMWAEAFASIATKTHWRLVVLGKPGCPADMVTTLNPPGIAPVDGPYIQCNQWHDWATNWINKTQPDLLVVTQEAQIYFFNATQWERGLQRTLRAITSPKTRKIVLGNIPLLPQSGPTCLAAHTRDVQACSAPRGAAVPPFNQVERAVATSVGASYIDTTSWFCSATCTAVIGNYEVYLDTKHLTATYSLYLRGVLEQALFHPSQAIGPPGTVTDLFTSVESPRETLSGSVWLAADASSDNLPVTRVEFRLSGGGLRDHLIGTGTKSSVGWLFYWNTTTVVDGTYTLQSVAYDALGTMTRSTGIRITLRN
jgi:peptidoglycan/LPS O-acetylase OafA/YrhL